MKISWIDSLDRVSHELKQLEEEGRDIDTLRRRWITLESSHSTLESRLEAAEHFLDELEDLPLDPQTLSDEPSDLGAILSACGDPAAVFDAPAHPPLADRIAGGWYGRAAGCLLGKPVEKIPREGIREILQSNGSWPLSAYITEKGVPRSLLEKHPWNRHYGRESLRENILCMPEDDDMNYPMLNLWVLEQAGPDFTSERIGAAWLQMLPVLSTFTAERVAYCNLLEGFTPPATATHRNPYREWIGAQIRGDLFGWVAPGRPRRAAELAHRDASLSHVRNGIYGEMFVAAMIASACCLDSPRKVLESGLAFVPPRSRFAEAVRFALSLPSVEPTWEGALDRLYGRYGTYHWVHAVNNAALVTAALLYGEGDFGKSICNVVMGGWDTDSNGATVGSVVGTMKGVAQLPAAWTSPLRNRIRSSLKGFDNSTIDALAERTLALARGQ